MSMTGGYKKTPETEKAVKKGVQQIEDFFSGKTPRKTPEQAKADREAWKQKSMADVKARNEEIKAKGVQRERETAKKDAANLASLQKQHAEMESTYNKGKNWEYADREQNLSDEERTARNMRGNMGQLAQRIENVKKYGYKQGGKVMKMAYGGSDVQANVNAAYARDMAASAKRYQQQEAAKQASSAGMTKTYTPASKSSYTTPVSSSYVSRSAPPAGFRSSTPTPKPAAPVQKVVVPAPKIAAPAPAAKSPSVIVAPVSREAQAKMDREAVARAQARYGLTPTSQPVSKPAATATSKPSTQMSAADTKALADAAAARAAAAKAPVVLPKAPTSYGLGAVNKPRSAYKEGGKVSTHVRSKSSPNW